MVGVTENMVVRAVHCDIVSALCASAPAREGREREEKGEKKRKRERFKGARGRIF